MATFTFQGYPIHYSREGEGKPLVFLHGLGGNSINWLYQRNYFKQKYQCITVDMPGHGKSGGGNELDFYDYQVVLKQLLLDELQLDEILLCGVSMGGRVALDFAARYPDSVSGLVVADSFAGLDEEEKKRRKSIFDLIYEPHDGVDRWVRAVIDQMGLDPEGAIAKGFNKGILGNQLDFMYKLFTLLLDYDQRNMLSSISAPALILHGERDRFIPLACSEDLHHRLIDSELVILPECGHLPNVEQPKRFNQEVERFIQKV
ncbi:alpha/beta fold hydrolase [Ammoniphilus sp. CFH 90114]|uniref:alpha/beta fold hydrolase n=1 Tax=Ammoniphilus sp. CFH 90114 TaxID=2493665 RepID=UPI00100E3635|nr:alpha/beta hydrolase [Ammoniphilus sp. CFH 90114]RXT04484.1 alpha/beta hydrolase [Ammoniphilus sp. CFH 90114]